MFYEDLNHIVSNSEFVSELLLATQEDPDQEETLKAIFETSYLSEDAEGVGVIVKAPRVLTSLDTILDVLEIEKIKEEDKEKLILSLLIKKPESETTYTIKDFNESEGFLVLYLSKK